MPEVRIGVFVCHCGNNIGGVVDVPEVVEYAGELPDVVYTEHNLYTCSEDGLSSIKKNIKEFNLNRVVVASCTPRTHESVFKNACEEAGLNKYLFEFVNIREQCSWVHMQLKEEATEKAKELVRMGVAKARLLELQEETEIDVRPSSLVIGGGIAGMSAALNLANQGFYVHLVEKEKELGGLLRAIYKLFIINEEAEKLIAPIIERVRNHPRIKTYLSATIKDVRGFIGNFDVTLNQQEEIEFKVGTIIVATGAEEFKPVGHYGYGKMSNVFTQLELEEMLARGISVSNVRSVVMINCVGARIPERQYCSRFCCMTAIKNAMLIKESNPRAKVFILHRDLMAYGVEYEDYYRRAMEAGVRFLRHSSEKPPEILGSKKSKEVKVCDELSGKELRLPSDVVILTTPLVSNPDNGKISKMLKVPLGKEGFFLEAHVKLRPVEFATEGIYLCGSARWPVDVSECVTQAYAASAKAAIPMRKGSVKFEAITCFVNEDICSGCGVCEVLCPYSAIAVDEDTKVARVNEALCKGCGVCSAACPSGAAGLKGFKPGQILSMIGTALG